MNIDNFISIHNLNFLDFVTLIQTFFGLNGIDSSMDPNLPACPFQNRGDKSFPYADITGCII